MKKYTFLFIILAFSLNVINAQTTENKEFLLDYFEETAVELKKNIRGLSGEQMIYKTAEDDWSIAQCVEHIILAEKMIFDMAKALLEKPANPERKSDLAATDRQIIEGIVDRSQKASAPQMLQPTGKYSNPEEAIEDFKTQREQILAFLETVPLEKLRNHIGDAPGGPADAYQSFLFIAGHTARHTLQIEEVKSNDGFPK